MSADGSLTREQVVSIYRQLLERAPSEQEIDDQLAAIPTLDGMLRVALDSDEYATLLRERGADSSRTPTFVNVFHPDLAQWGFPPGTRSDDGVAIVGHDGWLFLCGGTNANLGQYVGAVEMEPAWLDEWRDVVRRRAADLRTLGVASALLVVPDKLAVYEEHYPENLTRVGPRPIERLLTVPDLPIVYPLAELRAGTGSGEEVYLRTDTHLTFRGNERLVSSVLDALEVEGQPDLAALPLRSYPIAGDLGNKFDPQIVSIVSEPNSLHHARIVEDNHEGIAAVNGHIGTRRVFRNEQAQDRRVAVLFGDSFGFGAPRYQGLSWFLAQVFQEVHFVWVPFGWDPDYVRRVGAKAVLVQGAERFVARVPHLSVEVARLAEETLRRKQPLDIEVAFD
jgi:alginate O-acetyltransferase complex protein AlgJ